MTLYTVKGSSVFVGSDLDVEVYDTLPANTYVVCFDQLNNMFYLTIGTHFTIPEKLYGDTAEKADRFLATFKDRTGTTGVLLSGSKGSGKSLVMKVASLRGLELGYPTLIISEAYRGEAFNKFIQSIDQSCILIFDEFEKIYDEDDQEKLLTLFDGTFTSHKLMILTCNDTYRIDYHMTNRPGRMYYYLKYSGVTEEFVREYCGDRLNDQTKTEAIARLSAMFDEFNFDMLKALVEELNRYPNESVKEVVSILNIKYENRYVEYDVALEDENGERVPDQFFSPTTISNPIQMESVTIELFDGPVGPKKKKPPMKLLTSSSNKRSKYGDDACEAVADSGSEVAQQKPTTRSLEFDMQSDDVEISSNLSRIVVNENGMRLILTKVSRKQYDYMSLLT